MILIRGKWRRRLIGLTGIVFIAACGFAAFRMPVRPPGDLSLPVAFDRILPEIRFTRVPLQEAIQFFSEFTGQQIVLDKTAATYCDANGGLPITLVLRSVKLSKALRTTLANASTQLHLAQILRSDGRIVVTSHDALPNYAIERRYDLRGVLGTLSVHGIDDEDSGSGSGSTRHELLDAVQDLLQETIDSESWTENGGNAGSMRWEGGYLRVRQLPQNHRALDRLLDQLEETRHVPYERWIAVKIPR